MSDLLLLSRVRKTGDVPKTPMDMSGVFTEAMEVTAPSRQTTGATVTLDGVLDEACGYAPWVVQVWVNLLNTACTYGGNNPQIVCSSLCEGGQVRFRVRNSGPGIPVSEQEKLFTEFTRLGNAHTGGHGLGLSIVKRIIETLGGSVGVVSDGTKGVEFWFELPRFCS
jgi:two-component system, sensor histidine kinase and response regulator